MQSFPSRRRSSLRTLFLAALNLFASCSAIGLLSGCNDPAAKPANDANKQSAVVAADSAEVVKLLEDAKAAVTKSAEGTITAVTFRADSPLTNDLAIRLPELKKLQSLTVNSADLQPAGWEALGKLTALKQLDLRDLSMNEDQFKQVVSGMTQLTTLRLSGKTGATTVQDTSMSALKACTQLKVLALDNLWIGDAGLAELAGVKDLRELYVGGSLVDDAALERVGKIATLKKLRLARTSVSGTGLQHLTNLKIEDLDLSECSLIDNAALEQVGKISSLKKLNLWRDAIGDDGVKSLAQLKSLEWLNLDNTQITDGSIPVVAGFTKLTFLHLGSTAVSNDGIAGLHTLTSLADLKVTRTSVTEEGAAELQKKLPKVNIQIKYRETEEAP